MVYELVIKPEAETDMSEAFEWYEKARIGLGFDFLNQIKAGLGYILKHPFAVAEKYRSTRHYLIKRFPYKIIYSVEHSEIIVLAVIYGGRDPEWMKKRVKGAQPSITMPPPRRLFGDQV